MLKLIYVWNSLTSTYFLSKRLQFQKFFTSKQKPHFFFSSLLELSHLSFCWTVWLVSTTHTHTKNWHWKGIHWGRHSSVDSSVPTILLPWVWIRSTQSIFYHLLSNLYYICLVKRTKINKKRSDLAPKKHSLGNYFEQYPFIWCSNLFWRCFATIWRSKNYKLLIYS